MKALNLFLLLGLLTLIVHSCSLDDADKPCQVTGKISKLDGTPLGEVQVELKTAYNTFETRTDAQGYYSFNNLPSGFGNLTLKKDEYNSFTGMLTFANGNTVTFNHTLRTVIVEKEEAYLKANSPTVNILNNTQQARISIESNVAYSITWDAAWLSFPQTSFPGLADISFVPEPNETEFERSAEITITGTYGLTTKVTIVQSAGPVLRILSIENLENKLLALQKGVYVHYSRPVDVLEITSTHTILTPKASLLNNGKTVHLQQLMPSLFEASSYSLKVKASDGIQIPFEFNLTGYEGSYAAESYDGGDRFTFVSDDAYCWVSSYPAPWTLRSMPDLQVVKQIPDYHIYQTSVYNPANKLIYAIRKRATDTYSADLYQPSTAVLLKEVPLSLPPDGIYDFTFSENGIGLFLNGNKVYALHSKENNRIEALTYNNTDPHLMGKTNVNRAATFNQSKGFILFREWPTGTIIHVNANTLQWEKIGDDDQYTYCMASKYTPEVVLYSYYTGKVKIMNTQNRTEKTYTVPDYGRPILLENDEGVYSLLIVASGKLYMLRCTDGTLTVLPDSFSKASGMAYSNTGKYMVLHQTTNSQTFRYYIYQADIVKQLLSTLP